jgi:hypothetical protein
MKRQPAMAMLIGIVASATYCADRAYSQQIGPDVNPDTISVLVPAFFSKNSSLGQSVGNILSLEIWQTLRKTDDRHRPLFGNGAVRWSKLLTSPTQEAATKSAAAVNAQMVLWGNTYPLGRGFTVLSYLTIPAIQDHRLRHFERWSLTFKVNGKQYDVVADIPTRRYSFEPITLTSNIVSHYSKAYSLPVYDSKTGGHVIGHVGRHFKSLSDTESALPKKEIHIQAGRLNGWVRLPDLSEKRPEVSDFVGGILRIYRADWMGASVLFSRVLDNHQTPTHLRVDCSLYLALAAYNQGLEFHNYLIDAEKLNPFASRVVRYRVMGMLAGLQHVSDEKRFALVTDIKAYLDSKALLFSAHDDWLSAVRNLMHELTTR